MIACRPLTFDHASLISICTAIIKGNTCQDFVQYYMQETRCFWSGSKEYMDAFSDDLSNAAKSILIASPYLQKSRVTGLSPMLENAITNGIPITIYSKPIDSYHSEQQNGTSTAIAQLERLGAQVWYFRQNFSSDMQFLTKVLSGMAASIFSHLPGRKAIHCDLRVQRLRENCWRNLSKIFLYNK